MQTSKGWEQAIAAGEQLRAVLAQDAPPGSHPLRAFFYTSPYLRCKQARGAQGLLRLLRSDRSELGGSALLSANP